MLQWLILFTFMAGAAPSHDKTSCTSKELTRQDCRLIAGPYVIRLLAKTIAWNDGTWHTVDDMPLKGEAVAWEKVDFKLLNGWPILQLWLWEKGTGETQVESLHWFVADAEKRKFTMLAEGVVRKRRLEPVEPEAVPTDGKPVKAQPPRKPKYLYDAMEPHSLKAGKNGSLEWQLTSQKKIISKVLVQPEKKHGI